MKKCGLFVLMTVLFSGINAQLQDRIWIFGRPITGTTSATIYFGNLANPVPTLPIGQPSNITTSNGFEQWAVATDPLTGNLFFYTDGKNVFDNQHNLVSNLDLGGHVSSSQPVAISVVPRSDLKSPFKSFYIFSNGTGGFPTYCDFGIVTYRTFDVISQTFGPIQNLPGAYGMNYVSEGMKIIPCDTSADILWLIVSLLPDPGYETKYVVYKIDKTIITFHGAFDIGPQKKLLATVCSPIVDITYTKANTIQGITIVGFALQYSSAVFTCQFDNINGQFLTNTVKVCNTGYSSSIPSVYNCEFSPNGRFLYYSVYKTAGDLNQLYQIDLQDVVLTPTLIHTYNYTYGGGLKLGPDSLIYHIYDNGVNSYSTKLGRVLQPNVKYIPGTTNYNSFYQENFQTYSNINAVGLCEFLTMTTNNVGISQVKTNLNYIEIFPNPSAEILIIIVPQKSVVEILTLQGQIVERINTVEIKTSINISDLTRGIYIVKAVSGTGTSTTKFIKD